MTKDLAEAGLDLPESDLNGLGDVVGELGLGAEALRGERSYANEPAALFRLPIGGRAMDANVQFDVELLTIAEVSSLIRTENLSPVELAEATFRRIAALDR